MVVPSLRGDDPTYNVVVGAADGVRRAGIAGADAHDRERRAVQADQAGDVPDNDAEEAQEERHRRGVRLWGHLRESIKAYSSPSRAVLTD